MYTIKTPTQSFDSNTVKYEIDKYYDINYKFIIVIYNMHKMYYIFIHYNFI